MKNFKEAVYTKILCRYVKIQNSVKCHFFKAVPGLAKSNYIRKTRNSNHILRRELVTAW